MNTEIFEYFKKLSQRENIGINIANSFLGMFIIVMGIVGMFENMMVLAYALMFGAGSAMFVLNFHKALKSGNNNKYFFLAAGVGFFVIACFFVYMLVR